MNEARAARRLIEAALVVARRRGAALRRLDLRLGAKATSTPSDLRDAFARELRRRGLSPIALTVSIDRRHPGGVDVVGVGLREAPAGGRSTTPGGRGDDDAPRGLPSRSR
ncbi:MAG: hypothetical protein R3B09_30075 [Nannocystaceae bacterium]